MRKRVRWQRRGLRGELEPWLRNGLAAPCRRRPPWVRPALRYARHPRRLLAARSLAAWAACTDLLADRPAVPGGESTIVYLGSPGCHLARSRQSKLHGG